MMTEFFSYFHIEAICDPRRDSRAGSDLGLTVTGIIEQSIVPCGEC